jgi:peroxiredoxin Q/BCP
MKKTLIIMAGFLTTLLGAADLKVGDAAPDFALKGSDGKTYKLSDYKGNQAVVIAWFPKAFTGGWTKQCESFRANGKELRKFNVAYFTASCDPADGKNGNINFAKSIEADYPILSDPTKATAKAYGVVTAFRPFPHRWTFYIGKDGKILKIDKKVKFRTDGANAAKALKALGVEAK